jgi:hypothetical protein
MLKDPCYGITVLMITDLEQTGRGGELDDGQCHNIWFAQSRPTFDLSEVGSRQQSQYNAQLENRDWMCFFQPCMVGTTFYVKGCPITLD